MLVLLGEALARQDQEGEGRRKAAEFTVGGLLANCNRVSSDGYSVLVEGL